VSGRSSVVCACSNPRRRQKIEQTAPRNGDGRQATRSRRVLLLKDRRLLSLSQLCLRSVGEPPARAPGNSSSARSCVTSAGLVTRRWHESEQTRTRDGLPRLTEEPRTMRRRCALVVHCEAVRAAQRAGDQTTPVRRDTRAVGHACSCVEEGARPTARVVLLLAGGAGKGQRPKAGTSKCWRRTSV
jgi:hypothetical protein